MISTAALLILSTFAQSPDDFVELQKLAEGIYACIRKEPPGLAVDSNVLFIVNDKDVVMVDANIGPESAGATLRILRKITDKPVSAIIATHYHDDHMGGVDTVLQAFPKAELIAHESTPRAIEELLKPARKGMIDVAPQMSKLLSDLMEKGKSFGGWPITDEERTSYKNDIRIAERYAKEMPGIPLPKPTRLVKDKLVLKRGSRRIEILHLGKGHTPSDLAVWLPNEKIVAAGDLVVYPVPLVGGPQSYIKEWSDTLARVRQLGPKQVVPGHGPVFSDLEYVSRLGKFFLRAYIFIEDCLRDGKTSEQIGKEFGATDIEAEFCGNSKVRKVLWDNYVKLPTIAAIKREWDKKRRPGSFP